MSSSEHLINIMISAVCIITICVYGISCKSSEQTESKDINSLKPIIPTMEVAIQSQKVFRFQFNPNLFGWTNPEAHQNGNSRHLYTYQPSLKGLPDMPYWMRYKYSHRHKAGFIYGVPPNLYPNHQLIEMNVVALNHGTFDTGLLHLVINITQGGEDEVANRCVRLKIDNLNLEDIFDAHRLRNLKGIFKHHLWKESSKDLHLTFIASSVDVGYRRPVIPTEKDGVVLQLGSNSNFSEELLELNRETSPLRTFTPTCPRNFKRTSVERHFREKSFALDWCAFRLMKLNSVQLPSKTWKVFKEINPEQEDDSFLDRNEVDKMKGDSYNHNTNTSIEGQKDVNSNLNEAYGVHSTREDSEFALDDSKDAIKYLEGRYQEFPKRSDIPVRRFTQEFVLSIVPVIVVFIIVCILLFGIFCTNDSSKGAQDGEQSVESLPWDGFVESFFLVLKDCISCCNVFGISDKDLENPLISAQEKFQAKLRMAEKQLPPEARSRRASSVQRQTDSLRRLAATRDITPRLQSPRPTSSLLILADNQSLASDPVVAGSINIPIASDSLNIRNSTTIMHGSGYPSTSQHFDTLNRNKNSDMEEFKRRSANLAYDEFQQEYFPDSRPAPPPYLSSDPTVMGTFQNGNTDRQDQDAGTYLV